MDMNGPPGGLTPRYRAGGFLTFTPTRNLVAVLVAVEPSGTVTQRETHANDDDAEGPVPQRFARRMPRLAFLVVGAFDLAHNP